MFFLFVVHFMNPQYIVLSTHQPFPHPGSISITSNITCSLRNILNGINKREVIAKAIALFLHFLYSFTLNENGGWLSLILWWTRTKSCKQLRKCWRSSVTGPQINIEYTRRSSCVQRHTARAAQTSWFCGGGGGGVPLRTGVGVTPRQNRGYLLSCLGVPPCPVLGGTHSWPGRGTPPPPPVQDLGQDFR